MGNAPNETVYDFSAPLLDGRLTSLSDFRSQVLLVVNTASKCGFTPQYAGLEQLHRTYRLRGFSVLGFPCNQFGAQEPGAADEIGAFCEQNYGVTFPVFRRIDVNGKSAHPLYRFLKASKPGLFGSQAIKWNFTKFLIDRRGGVIGRFGPTVNPESLVSNIQQQLESV